MHTDDLKKVLEYADVVLDSKEKFAFFTHNKNAQTSINRHLLASRSVIKKDNIDRWNCFRKKYLEKSNNLDIVTFTIIRNPIERYISAFCYLQKIKKIDQKADVNNWTINVFHNIGTNFDPHFTSQEKYHKSIIDLNFDFILNFDRLQEDWIKLAKKISAPKKLPHANSTASKNFDLSNDSLKIIEDKYYEDFILFKKLQ